ncbi:MAG: hypothetical protein Q7U31_01365 [Anaerolineaceae bacterium]|nr:hypothetical protein [Anaerolineaceae bacterium]
MLSIFAGWGLVVAWKQRKKEPYSLMLWAAAGIFLSVPFVPPNDSNQMRVYAATVTFLLAFSTIGLKSILGLVTKHQKEEFRPQESKPGAAILFGLTLATVTIGGVLLVKAIAKPQDLVPVECPTGETQMLVRFTAGSMVKIGEEPISQQISVPLNSFVEIYEGYPEMHAALVQAAGEGAVLAKPLDLLSMQFPLLVINDEYVIDSSGVYALCVVPFEDEELTRRGWMEVRSLMKIQ